MPEMERRATCPLDCPGACALIVTIEDGRVMRIRGAEDHPHTQGVICGKVTRFAQVQEGPRVTTPLIRAGAKGEGRFREASWDEALDLAADRLGEIAGRLGPEAILPYYYGGTMGTVQRPAVERLGHRAGYSRLGKTICSAIGGAGWRAGTGRAVGPDPAEMVHSDLIILWGINAVSTNINLMTFVKAGRKNGARLVVVDPYRNRTARLADEHIAPRPGTDGALAIAMMNVMLAEGLADEGYLAEMTDFDGETRQHLLARTPEWAAPITGLDPERIRDFARAYGRARAPFLRIGIGMSRHGNGAVNLHAVSALPALTGAWRAVGGGALFTTSDAFALDDEPVTQNALAGRSPGRILDMTRLGAWLTNAELDPKVAGLLVFNANPAGSCPDLNLVRQGLLRDDLFTLVHEIVMSDTARLADVVLPATTFLEHADLYKSYGQATLQWADAILPPTGQARCNHEVVNDLAQRLGFDDDCFHRGVAETADLVLAASGLPARLEWNGASWLDLTPEPDAAHFRQGFGNADGRFHFRPGWPDPAMPALPDHWPMNRRDLPEERERFPLDFMTPPAHDVLNTTFTACAAASRRQGPPRLKIHPEDAARRRIGDGDRVRVFNDLGSLTMTAQVTGDVALGLCLCESNFRADAFPEGISLNALTHAGRVAPAGGGAFHDNRVEVARLAD